MPEAPHWQHPWTPPTARPGVVPLRPLTLGDIFGGALETIRRNGAATVGMALLVTLAFMLVPIAGAVVVGAGDLVSGFDLQAGESSAAVSLSDVSVFVASLLSSVFNALATIVIVGLIVRVAGAAVVGRPMRPGEAWARTRRRLPALVGLALVTGLASVAVVVLPVGVGAGIGLAAGSRALAVGLALLLGVAGVVVLVWGWVRLVLLAAPALVLEDIGVRRSLARARELSRGQFWRLFGIALLAQLAAGIVGQVIAVPFAVGGIAAVFLLPDSWSLAGLLLTSNVATVVTGGLIGPFTAGITALQYVDQRFRKEGLDITLLEESLGGTTPTDRR
ncbi:hypothetical protein SAMN04488570_2183 [Nocardioides scoriae]|uniref:Membrane domain of glycerophosphoryl diester phosphodiesterase n=1 Tax=Nocardioides scoriae TaxID=642780 RepID=A0A1H1TAX1_9ACTN|nr:hypothetical protein [Nocardioides scoriae]SDS57288.1 hypothetical protein SAMN04488570_2183 [Nocardioides scoriae]